MFLVLRHSEWVFARVYKLTTNAIDPIVLSSRAKSLTRSKFDIFSQRRPQIEPPPNTKRSFLGKSRLAQLVSLETRLLAHSTVNLTHTGFTSFQSFHTPASSISDGYEPYHSAQSSPLTHSRPPSSSRSIHNHRSYHSLSASTMSSLNVNRAHDHSRTIRQ